MSIRTENRPAPTTDSRTIATGSRSRPSSEIPLADDASPAPETGRARLLDLSVAQVLGGSLAAATAAAAGSRLGVIGTITGAAFFSVVASVAGALYTSSLRRTGRHVSSVLRGADRPTIRPGDPAAEQPADEQPADLPDLPAERPAVRRLLAGAAVVFVLAALVVTGIELVTGRSLDGGSGTTIARTVEGPAASGSGTTTTGPGRNGSATPTPTTDPSASASPSVSPTATDTGSASAAPSPSASATASPSGSPTPNSTTSPSASPTPSGPGSATSSPAPSSSPSPSSGDLGYGDQADYSGEAPLSR